MSADQYRLVNGAWPEGQLPELTGPEAAVAVRVLWRAATGEKARIRKIMFTSGNRHNYIRIAGGDCVLNPDRGWRGLIHSISHRAHRKVYPGRRPHDGTHVMMERRLIDEVVKRGWLEGTLKRPTKILKKPIDVRAVRYQRVLLKLQMWNSKRKRAITAIAKLERQRRYYEKALQSAGAMA